MSLPSATQPQGWDATAPPLRDLAATGQQRVITPTTRRLSLGWHSHAWDRTTLPGPCATQPPQNDNGRGRLPATNVKQIPHTTNADLRGGATRFRRGPSQHAGATPARGKGAYGECVQGGKNAVVTKGEDLCGAKGKRGEERD